MSIISSIIRNRRYILPSSSRVGYIGWIGHGNIGDEAIYKATLDLFPEYNILPFKYSLKIELIEKCVRKKMYSAIMLGGGTLINRRGSLDILKTSCNHGYKPWVAFGPGVASPFFWVQRMKRENILGEWIDFLDSAAFVGVRGPLSQSTLYDGGYRRAEIIGDTALQFGRETVGDTRRGGHLGINIGVTNPGEAWADEEIVLRHVVSIADIYAGRGWKITFMPVCREDLNLNKEAIRRMKSGARAGLFLDFESIGKTLDFLETCDLFIGEKLHSVILGCCVYTPSVMLEYRPKCLDFMQSIGMEKYNVRIDRLSLEQTLGLLDGLMRDFRRIQDHLHERVCYYKKLQKERSSVVKKIFSSRVNG